MPAEDLVPGVNPAFLRDRLAVPLGIVEGVMRWGLADPTDHDTLAALRFASRAPIASVRLTRQAILALLGDGADQRIDAVPRMPATPHVDAVVELRSYLVQAFAAAADRIEIDGSAGTLVVSKAASTIVRHTIETTRAEALTAAAEALVAGRARRPSRLSIAYRDTRVWVTVEPRAGGVALLLDPVGET